MLKITLTTADIKKALLQTNVSNKSGNKKIDYNTAPDSGTTVDNWTGRQADWYLNMYYQDTDTDYTKNYNTSTISNTNVSQKLEVIRNLYVNMIEEGTHTKERLWVPSI